MGNGSLGDDEQNTPYFGHISPGLLQRFQFTEFKFFCESSGTNRKIDFRTSNVDCLNYLRTGTGSCRDVTNDLTPRK